MPVLSNLNSYPGGQHIDFPTSTTRMSNNLKNIHDYIYRIFNGKGSGEYALTRVLDVGAVAKLPLLDRCPEKFVKMKLPTLWLYGDKDWMNDEAGLEMTNEINDLSIKENSKTCQFPYHIECWTPSLP